MPRKVNVLTDMQYDEVSLVDKPAAPLGRVAIAKRATEEDTVPDIFNENGEPLDADSLKIGDIVYDADGEAYQLVEDEDGGEGAVSEEKEFASVGKSLSDSVRSELSKALTDIERDEIIAKAVGEVSKAEKRAVEAEKIAKAERDLRLTREYIEVAKNYNVPSDPGVLGPVLKRMAESMSYEDCEVIHKALSAAGETIYDEVGFIGGGDNVDVMSKVDAFLSERVEKSDTKVSKAQLTTEFFRENPDAYDEYLRDQAR